MLASTALAAGPARARRTDAGRVAERARGADASDPSLRAARRSGRRKEAPPLPRAWTDVHCPGVGVCGRGRVVDLPEAPFPFRDRPWQDSSVYLFVPEGFRDRGRTDVVLHFHGWYTDLADTLSLHAYAQHLWASGLDAVLVVPQGPRDAASSDIGRLELPGAPAALVDAALGTLAAEGIIAGRTLGDVLLTAHSGGYLAAGRVLVPDSGLPRPRLVGLFDAFYGLEEAFGRYAASGGRLRSNWIEDGGTVGPNSRLPRSVEVAGYGTRALRDAPAASWKVRADHWAVTWADDAYAEVLRWGGRHHRRGPRVELRSAACEVVPGTTGGDPRARVRWLSPEDEDLVGWRVERWQRAAPDRWDVVAELPPESTEAHVPCTGEARLRVRPVVNGVADVLGSDVVAVAPHPDVLVVDGIDRLLDEPTPGLVHDAAARVAEAVDRAAVATNEAVVEGDVALGDWETVIWLAGPDGGADRALSRAERELLTAYVAQGGHLVVSGSDVAWELGRTDGRPSVRAGERFIGTAPDGAETLVALFGARWISTRRSVTALRAGPLAFTVGERAPVYAVPSMDALGTARRGVAVAWYADGKAAAVGLRGRAVLAGFPLELIDTPAARSQVIGRLVRFAQGK